MMKKNIHKKKLIRVYKTLILFLGVLTSLPGDLYAQNSTDNLVKYTPEWIREGFAVGGPTWEPWMFMMRRNNSNMGEHNYTWWQKDIYEEQLSEKYIKSLKESGVTVYHLGFYKGFGIKAEKENMEKMAKAAAIAHKYGLKVATYIQWSTLCYETFFNEVPEAKTDLWYQMDVNGKPLLPYGDRAPFRYTPCFSNDSYMNYLKEKVIRYALETVKTDFIHFDNFAFMPAMSADYNPATISAFRKYLSEKYTSVQRIERFGFDDLSNFLPPSWVTPPKMTVIDDPVIQEWIDFRSWILEKRLQECSTFARKINKEVVIEVNCGGLVGNNRAWEIGINHPSLMRYTNVIWAEDRSYPRWEEGVAIGKFRSFKMGRTTNNFILTYVRQSQDFAEELALNRSIGYLGEGTPTVLSKKYLDFWLSNKRLYTNMQGAEKVAAFRSYPSMAYNTYETHIEADMAEQVLQQKQIPFDIIFDQQLDKLKKYDVLVLADQECLTDEVIASIKQFVNEGGGLVMTNKTGRFDGWHRLRKIDMLTELSFESKRGEFPEKNKKSVLSFNYGEGRVVYLPELEKTKEGELRSGFQGAEWMMPKNASELESAVYWVSENKFPLKVTAPEWVGVSHDKQDTFDVVHLVNYNHSRNVAGVILQYSGKIRKAWTISPDEDVKTIIPITEKDGITELKIPDLEVYKIVVMEKK